MPMKKFLPLVFILSGFIVNGQTISSKTATYNWDEKESYVNHFSRVLKNDKFTFIDQKGKPLTLPVFEGARNFSNNLAAVQKAGKWGFINDSGFMIIPCDFDIVFDFKENVTAVSKDKKWFLINTSGTVISSPDIDIFYGFKNGLATIEKNGQKGQIDLMGIVTFNNENSILNNRTQRGVNSSVNNASGDCPNNLDFENGSFNEWRCFTGTVDSVGNTNVITVFPSNPVINRHKIITRSTPSAIDPYGLFSTNPPDGSNFAVRLGNTNIGGQAERIQYTIRVPQNDSDFSIKYDYAVVFQDPGHTPWSQPRFIARLFDSAANSYVNCASFEYISTSNLPGFTRSSVDTSVIYKTWSSVFISMRAYAGKTMYLEFTTADCVRRGHWGYAYVDVESSCGQSVFMNYDCNYPNITTLDGPPGFQSYNWWNQNFTTLLSSGQNTVLNPGPRVNSTIWLEMIPYNTFGCRDTMAVKISGEFTPSITTSENNIFCAPHSVTFTNNNTPSVSAIWNFGDGTTGSGDVVNHTYLLPGTYVVSLNVTLPSGCNGIVNDTIVISQPTANFNYNAGLFCNNQTINFNTNASNIDSLVWDFGDGTSYHSISSNVSHIYNTGGMYIPVLTVYFTGGCSAILTGTDTIKIENISSDFNYAIQQVCNATTVSFSNASGSVFATNSYRWDFGDGTTGIGSQPNHTYTSAGVYNVKLITSGSNGCSDSIVKPVTISILTPPSIIISGPSEACAMSSTVFSSNLNANANIATVSWNTSNGLTASGENATFSFNNAGTFSISVHATTVNGCNATSTSTIVIKPIPVITSIASQNLCNGGLTNPINFTSSLSNANFTWTNDNTSIGLSSSGIGNIPQFTAINTNAYSLNANISVVANAQGCNSDMTSFTINVNPTPQAVQPADQQVCNRTNTEAIIFSSFNVVASNEYTWTNNLPSIGLAANGSGNILSFLAQNNSNASLTATITITPSSMGCIGLPVAFRITVNPTPTIDPLNDHAVCNGLSTDSIAFSSSITNTRYSWTNSDPSIGLPASGTGNIPPFTAVNSEDYPNIANINVSGASPENCIASIKTFKMIIKPTPNIAAGNDVTVCKGSSTNLTVTGADHYTWSPSAGLSCNNCSNPSATPNDSTTYFIEGTNNSGCKGYDTIIVSVIKPFDMLVSPDDTLCSGGTVQLNAFQADRYTWSPSTGLNADNIANPVASPNSSTTYQVIGYDNHNCFTDTGYVLISVGTSPYLNIGPDITATSGSTITLSPAILNGEITTYSWSPSTNLSCSNCSTTTLTVSGNASYVLTVKNRMGCVVSDTVNVVTFCKSAQVYVANAFTPDGDGLNDLLIVRGMGITVKSFRVFNRWGNLVFDRQNFAPNDPKYGWDGKIRGVTAAPDVYVYVAEVMCDNGTSYMYKGNATILK